MTWCSMSSRAPVASSMPSSSSRSWARFRMRCRAPTTTDLPCWGWCARGHWTTSVDRRSWPGPPRWRCPASATAGQRTGTIGLGGDGRARVAHGLRRAAAPTVAVQATDPGPGGLPGWGHDLRVSACVVAVLSLVLGAAAAVPELHVRLGATNRPPGRHPRRGGPDAAGRPRARCPRPGRRAPVNPAARPHHPQDQRDARRRPPHRQHRQHRQQRRGRR